MNRCLSFLGLMLALTITSTAQNLTSLVLDVPAEGTLDTATPTIAYAFASNPGNVLIEIIASSPLVPGYVLTNASGELIAQNTNVNADTTLADIVPVSEVALYILTIEGVNATVGDFVLTISADAGGGAVPLPVANCETIIEQSIDIIDTICSATGRNEVCYGNLNVLVDARDNQVLNFSLQGDIVPLALVDRLLLSPLNPDTDEWGVALMQVQADLPDTVPGQNVAILIFGNVQVQDSVETGSNMQSFYFMPGTGVSRCSDIPTDGILIRTPDGVGTVSLRVNEVDITLASTAFLTIEPNNTLDIVMIEGIGQVTALNGVQLFATGQRISVPVDEEGLPIAPPQFPQPIDLEDYESLPLPGLIESAPQPSQPIPTLQPTAISITETPIEEGRPPLPTAGNCVLRTLQDTEVNVRRTPTLDGEVTGFIRSDQLYTVTGINATLDWYQLSSPFGWVAGFVTERGGDCARLPLIIIPTSTPLPTATPIATQIPRPTEIDPRFVVADYNGVKVTYQGTISTFENDLEDTLVYSFSNVPPGTFFEREFDVAISCSVVSGAVVLYDYSGSVGNCNNIVANFTQLGGFNQNNSGSITIFFGQQTAPATITWTITLGFR